MRLHSTLFASVTALALVACGHYGSAAEDGTTADSSSALTRAVPRAAWFEIDLAATRASVATSGVTTKAVTPAAPPPSCDSPAPSDLAQLSRKIATDANGVLGTILGMIGAVTSQPPAAQSPDSAVWGPITSPTAPAVYRLEVHRVDDKVFSYLFAGRPKDGDESTWKGLLTGTVAPIDDAHQAGDAHADFAAAHALDPSSEPETGGLELHFEAVGDARAIDLVFGGVSGKGAPQPNDAHYHFEQPASGAGAFDFATRVDFDGDGTLDELLNVQSHWMGPMGGQALVTVTGGSMPKPAAVTQCWNAKGALVFNADDSGTHPPAGSPGCCPK